MTYIVLGGTLNLTQLQLVVDTDYSLPCRFFARDCFSATDLYVPCVYLLSDS